MTSYLFHLLVWILPFLLLQWVVGFRVLRANLRAIIPTTLIAGLYYSGTDVVAVRSGLWYFDDEQILGWHVLGVPIEEVLFFLLTALLVAQSVLLLLPARLRW